MPERFPLALSCCLLAALLLTACAAGEDREIVEPTLEPPGEDFSHYTEIIPESAVRFDMVAVTGGAFQMGSPPDEPGRDEDEGPQRTVQVGHFWMGKLEVTWREYQAYYAATATRGKNEAGLESDAVTGPTPPYGSPDQGWGQGRRPAITMTHYAATKYCQWLSEVTGRQYRLPTEAEWEYACRAGNSEAYFFQEPGEAGLFSDPAPREATPEQLDRYAWYRANSRGRTHPAGLKEPNAWGLHDMLGNVKEFCLDFYAPDTLAGYPEGLVIDPRGPASGEEHVVRGGAYSSRPAALRSAARDHTRHRQWLETDPQTPKSVWWYSDNNEVGFRVVRPYRTGAPGGGDR